MSLNRGIRKYEHDGATVLFLHYSGIPKKDPETPEGLEWLARESSTYPGGVRSTDWRREYENDWSVRGRELVFRNWQNDLAPAILCEPFVIPPEWPVFMGYDYGYRAPFCAAFWAFRSPAEGYLVDEIYETEVPTPLQAEMIKESFYWPRVKYAIGDPSIWREDQNDTRRRSMTSHGKILREHGVYIREGRNDPGVDLAYRDLLLGDLWRNLSKPKLFMFNTMKHHIAEYQGLHFKDYVSKRVAEENNPKETVASRKNHAWDADKYVMLSRPRAVVDSRTEAPEGSIAQARAEIMQRRRMLRRALH